MKFILIWLFTAVDVMSGGRVQNEGNNTIFFSNNKDGFHGSIDSKGKLSKGKERKGKGEEYLSHGNDDQNDLNKFLFYFRFDSHGRWSYFKRNSTVDVLETFNIRGIQVLNRSRNETEKNNSSEFPVQLWNGGNLYCFEIKIDGRRCKYKLCSPVINNISEIYCTLANYTNTRGDICDKSWNYSYDVVDNLAHHMEEESGSASDWVNISNRHENKTIIKQIIQPIIYLPEPKPPGSCNGIFNYDNHGNDCPCNCKTGTMQSPININTSLVKQIYTHTPTLNNAQILEKQVSKIPKFTYTETEADKVKLFIDKGVLKLQYNNFGYVQLSNGQKYYANEINFHTPSEHSIDNKYYDMELQILHRSSATNDTLILSLLFERKNGAYNAFMDDIEWLNLPTINNILYTGKVENRLNINKIFSSTLPGNACCKDRVPDYTVTKDFSFYSYEGSWTSPPCTENVKVIVKAEPIQLSSTVISWIEACILNNNYNKGNNRPLQESNGRVVEYYNLGVHQKECCERCGHFEKIKKWVTTVRYVVDKNENPRNEWVNNDHHNQIHNTRTKEQVPDNKGCKGQKKKVRYVNLSGEGKNFNHDVMKVKLMNRKKMKPNANNKAIAN